MNKYITILFFLLISLLSFSQDSICNIGAGCSDSPLVFPNTFDGSTAPTGPNYGCLGSQPNPAWYFLGFDQVGNLEIEISQVDLNGNLADVDFICYGPFTDPFIACNNLTILNAANTIDCSYSASAVEVLNINNAQMDQFYILLITNFDQSEGEITLEQINTTATSGSTDCSYACSVDLGGNQTLCYNTDYELSASLGNASISESATYKWFKNGVELANTDETLLVVGESTNISNTYKVEITANLCDDIVIDEVTLNYVAIFDSFKLTNISTIVMCNNDNDGFDTFDLRLNENEIANLENAADYTFTYYKDSNLTQVINTPSSYTNSTAYEETIYVSISHNTFIGCDNSVSFAINANDSPTAHEIDNWIICDDDNDGYNVFDFQSLEEAILNGQDSSSINISFHSTQDNANDNNDSLPLMYTNQDAFTLETIYVRVENSDITSCYSTISFDINVIRTPIANQIDDWFLCDDESNDGIETFDLSTLYTDLLNGQDETEINISFYLSQVDADFKITPIALNYTNQTPFNEEEIFVRMESNQKSDCYTISSFKIKVIQNPVFELVEKDKYICINLLPQTVNFEIENLQGNYEFSVYNDLGDLVNTPFITNTNTSISLTEAGSYTITAETVDGNNCTTSKLINLLPATPATAINFTMNEYWHKEIFSLDIQVEGTGMYQYTIDNENGPYQEDNVLINITPGIHTVYVKEINGCGVTSKIIDLFGFSEFFTPNGDGEHDFWQVQGINFKPTAKIHIFDRNGRLYYTFFPALNQKWDGTNNGKPAPEGEYWFTAEMTNYNGDPITRQGHFSLLRTNN